MQTLGHPLRIMGTEDSDLRPAKHLKYFQPIKCQSRSELTLRRPAYGDDLITVLVDAEQKRFVIHKEVLCGHSEFCRVACGRDWKEGREKTIHLQDTGSEVFRVYVHWLYTGTIDMTLMTKPTVPCPSDSAVLHPAYCSLGAVFILGNFLGDSQFSNCVIDCVLQKVDRGGQTPHPKVFSDIWEHTLQGSGIQRLFSDLLAARIHRVPFDTHKSQYPPDLIMDLATRYVQGVEKKCPTFQDRCKYHDHTEGEETCK